MQLGSSQMHVMEGQETMVISWKWDVLTQDKQKKKNTMNLIKHWIRQAVEYPSRIQCRSWFQWEAEQQSSQGHF